MVTATGKFKKLLHSGVIVTQDLFLASKPNWLVKQKHNSVDTRWKTALLQVGHRFFNRAVADHIVNIGLRTCIHK